MNSSDVSRYQKFAGSLRAGRAIMKADAAESVGGAALCPFSHGEQGSSRTHRQGKTQRQPRLRGGLPWLGHALEFHRDPVRLLRRAHEELGGISDL